MNRFLLTITLLLLGLFAKSQIMVLSSNINSYNITPQTLCQVQVMNYGRDVQAVLEARLTNSANQPLLSVKTMTFLLKKGMNSLSGYNIQLSSAEFGNTNQANYIQSSHVLPSGKFSFCCIIRPLIVTESSDDYCEDIESELSSAIFLISPSENDTIETANPLLIWNHSEPFNLLAAGEYFRVVVAALNHDQSAEAGVIVNVPVYANNYLSSHHIQYPFDAGKLEKGKPYGWQIHKIANGIIINKSEAWKFVIAGNTVMESQQAILRKTIDAGFYTVQNNKICFKFDEEYAAQKINCSIYNDKRKLIKPLVKNEYKSNSLSNAIDAKNNGYNRFEINLNELDINSGFHILEVKNEKMEVFFLKFYIN